MSEAISASAQKQELVMKMSDIVMPCKGGNKKKERETRPCLVCPQTSRKVSPLYGEMGARVRVQMMGSDA